MALQIKKFQGATLQEALEAIRAELGDDAIILQTEPIRTKGSMGFYNKNKIEVTAAVDREDAPPRFHATVGEAPAERSVAVPSSTPAPAKQGALSRLFTGATFGRKQKEVKTAVKSAKTTKASATAQTSIPSQTENSAPAAQLAPSMGQIYAVKTFLDPIRDEVEQLKRDFKKSEGSGTKGKKFKDPLETEVQFLREELRSFIVEKKFEDSKLPAYFQKITHFWKEKGLTDKQIHRILQNVQEWGGGFNAKTSDQDAASQINQLLDGAIQEANVLEKKGNRIVVLVGPTGVGKTTTIAKMAAYEKLRLNRSVSLITTDDFKVGGTDQLAHYARILEVPFAKSRADLTLEEQCKIQSAQTIFIDTFGVSFRDQERIAALTKMLSFKDPAMAARLEIHLVLPVAVSSRDIQDYISSYSSFKPDFLVFTKWDETDNWGGMLAAILASKKPVSFVSQGQSVPDDFALFSKASFLETITSFHGEQS